MMKTRRFSYGLYSLKNCHKSFGQVFQPHLDNVQINMYFFLQWGVPLIYLCQMWSPGRAGDLGQAVQRVAAVEGPTGIVPAQAARLVLEIGVSQDGVTPRYAQVCLTIVSGLTTQICFL